MSKRRLIVLSVFLLAGTAWILTSTSPVAGQSSCNPGGTSSLWANFVQAKLNGTSWCPRTGADVGRRLDAGYEGFTRRWAIRS